MSEFNSSQKIQSYLRAVHASIKYKTQSTLFPPILQLTDSEFTALFAPAQFRDLVMVPLGLGLGLGKHIS